MRVPEQAGLQLDRYVAKPTTGRLGRWGAC